MQTTSSIRKRLTLEQREELLRVYRRRDLTQREFARQQGIGLSTLQDWLLQTARRRKSPAPAVPTFLPVPNLLSAMPCPPAYRLQRPGGLTLEVRAGFGVPELAALLELLPALCSRSVRRRGFTWRPAPPICASVSRASAIWSAVISNRIP
jgi:hypothetical protein